MAELQEQAAKNNGIDLQASSKGKEKANQSSKNEESSHEEDDELDDEQMALFIKNFRRVFSNGNFRNYGKNKGKYEPRRRSNKPCFGCKKHGHFIADCPEEKKRTKMTKKALPRKKDQDTRNKPVKLTLVKNGILKKKVNPKMMLLPWHSRSLLIILLYYLKISPMMKIKIQSYVLWPRM